MRILFVVHQFLPKHAAGSEHYTYYLAKELQRRGHEVHLYVTEIDHGRPHADLRTGEYDGLHFHEAVNNHEFPDFRRTYADPAMEANLEVVLDAFRPDVVHLQHLYLHSMGYVHRLKERALPIVYTLHEYVLMCHRHGQLLREGLEICEGPTPEACAACARTWGTIERGGEGDPYLSAVEDRRRTVQAALNRVDLFLAPSRFLRDKFVDHGLFAPEKVEVSDYGMATEVHPVRPRTPSDRLRVGYFGVIGPWKGTHVLVDAFNELPESGVECRIHGDLSFLPEYVRDLFERRLHQDVLFLGAFDNARVGEVLSEIDVLVVPSLWFENSPLTIHEAFLAGVPVLTSDRGGMAELVDDDVNGLHFRMGDAADLAAKIRRLMDEPGLLERLRAGIPPVKDIASDADDMERRYHALLAPPTGASAGESENPVP